MTDSNLITVTELGQLAPGVDTSRYDSPTLSGIISAASKIATDFLDYTPLAEDITLEVKGGMITTEGDLLIFPEKPPIQRVDAIAIYRGATTVNLTLLDGSGVPKYNIDVTNRHIRYPYQEMVLQGTPIFTNFYSLRGLQFYTKLTYRGGWEPSALPAAIKQAVVYICRDLLTADYNQFGGSRISQGSLSIQFATSDGGRSLNMKMARNLLSPYRRIG